MPRVRITVRGGQGYISNLPAEPEGLSDALDRATSYRATGYQYTQRYQRTSWDGRTRLLRNSKFPVGLLGRILGVLRDHSVAFDVEHVGDRVPKPRVPMRVVGVESRWYQDEALAETANAHRGLIRAPTGSGKTAIGCRLIAQKESPAVVIVPTIDLLHQYRGFLSEHLEVEDGIGQLGDGVVDPRSITVATIRTMAKVTNVALERGQEFVVEADDRDDTEVDRRELHDWVHQIGTVLVDEAHVLGADVVFDVVTKIPATDFWGMSASPWRDDGADIKIEAATGPMVYRVETAKLVRDGYLVPPVFRVVPTADTFRPAAWGKTCARCHAPVVAKARKCASCGGTRFRSEYQDAYRHEVVENQARNELVARLASEVPKPALILVRQVKHGKILEELMDDAMFLSGTATGEHRAEVFDTIREGGLDVLIATSIADMGLDIPNLASLVLAGGGKSSTRHLQRIGRVARPSPGKTMATVVDLDDSHVHKWFAEQAKARRKIEAAEWAEVALWI